MKEFELDKSRAKEAVQAEHEAMLRVLEAESHTRALLEEQRNQLLSEAKL